MIPIYIITFSIFLVRMETSNFGLYTVTRNSQKRFEVQ
jgi:hypothetical protein